MEWLYFIAKCGVYAIMAVSVLAAVGVVLLPNLFHAALALVATLLGIAGIFFVLHAEFLAVVQILIYVGAVMTLVIFAIMLTERFGDKSVRQRNRLSIIALAGVAFFIGVMVNLILSTPWNIRQETLKNIPDTLSLGKALMTTYVFPFEVISVVLIVALIGAVIIAKKDMPR